MDIARIEETLQETAKLIPNLDKLMDKTWQSINQRHQILIHCPKNGLIKMTKLYTRRWYVLFNIKFNLRK